MPGLRQPVEIIIEGKSLKKILKSHKRWLEAKSTGQRTNFQRANFQRANLQGANLKAAKLWEADFQRAYLGWTNFYDADLYLAKFQEADLHRANLQWANLQGADLCQANVRWADLRGVNLRVADLHETNLQYSDLRFADLEGANITGVKFYAASTFGWKIKDIVCDYFYPYTDETKRIPSDRNFSEHEFELLYRSTPTVEYIFENGANWFDPILMYYVASRINEKKPSLGTSFVSFDAKGIFPKATFEVSSENVKEEASKEIENEYKLALEKVENENQFLRNLVKKLSMQPRQQLITGNASGPVIQAGDKSTITINTDEVKETLEEILKIIQKVPAVQIEGKTKKATIDIIKSAAGSIIANNIPTAIQAAQSVLQLQPFFGPDLAIEVNNYFQYLRKYVEDTGGLKALKPKRRKK